MILIALISIIFLTLGNYYLKFYPTIATVFGFISFSIGIGMSILLLYEVVVMIVNKKPVEPILLIFPVIAALGYSLAKKSITGVPAEVMGSKGLTGSIVRIVGTLTGKYGTPIQVFGVWLGFITMGASIAVILYAILEYISGRLSYSKTLTVALLSGFGIASGFVTGHLSMTAFLYPFYTLGTTMYAPVYIVTSMISLLTLAGSIYILSSK